MILKRRFCFLFIFCGVISSSFAQELNIGVSVSTSAQREAFYTLARDFEARHPNTQIHFTALSSEDYKLAFPNMIATDKRFDVLYWHAGQRLFHFVEKDLIQPIDDLWLEKDFDNAFDENVKQNLNYNGRFYAVPISYYQIGFYYSKEVFERLSLNEPSSWQEFLAVCESIKASGIAPIFIGTESNWPATAWFDYLNLRLNGLAFHLALTQGEVPFNDERVRLTLKTLYELKERDYFIENHQDFQWNESLPLLSRGLVGMSLIGNYVIQDIRKDMLPKFGFFPFPQISESVGKYEEAPIDILVIPKRAKNLSLAKAFLAFVANHDVQSKLNKKLGVISPHKLSQQQTSELTKEAYLELSTADGFSQFFDRDANEAFAGDIMHAIDKFMINGDIATTIESLELARSEHFPSLAN